VDRAAKANRPQSTWLTTKPFEMPELLARLRVIERRQGTASTAVIEISQVKLDTRSHKVYIDSQQVNFSKKEFMVLKALMENSNRILSREQIESRLYHWGEEVSSNAVEVHIHKLRKYLPEKFIENVRGVGYIINTLMQDKL
jgi:DNA-binding response OmpR family regulator